MTKRSKSGLLFAVMTGFSLYFLDRLNFSFNGGIFEFIGSEPARNVGMTPVRTICLLFWVGIIIFMMQPLYASGRLKRSSVRRVIRLLFRLTRRLPMNRIRPFRRLSRRSHRMQHFIHIPKIQALQLSLSVDAPLQSLMKTLEASSAEVIELSRSPIEFASATGEDSQSAPLVVGSENLPILWNFLCDAQPPETLSGSSPEPYDRKYLVSRSALLNVLHLLNWSSQESHSANVPESYKVATLSIENASLLPS